MKQTVTLQPTAHVSVKKNRQPKGSQVYLKNGQEFEIELFNPLTTTILAQISLNGTSIGGGGIILRPGEHVFIERFLDKQNKFKFETYEVDSNNSGVDQAIRNNGLVKIEFFHESLPCYPVYGNDTGSNWYHGGSFGKPNFFSGDINLYNCSSVSTNNANIGHTLTSDNASFTNTSNLNFLDLDASNLSKSLKSDKKETGRIEEGSYSMQQFETIDKKFDMFTFATVTYQILPLSTKPITASEIKVYCTECGSKRKKDSHKFCPTCGNKFE